MIHFYFSKNRKKNLLCCFWTSVFSLATAQAPNVFWKGPAPSGSFHTLLPTLCVPVFKIQPSPLKKCTYYLLSYNLCDAFSFKSATTRMFLRHGQRSLALSDSNPVKTCLSFWNLTHTQLLGELKEGSDIYLNTTDWKSSLLWFLCPLRDTFSLHAHRHRYTEVFIYSL